MTDERINKQTVMKSVSFLLPAILSLARLIDRLQGESLRRWSFEVWFVDTSLLHRTGNWTADPELREDRWTKNAALDGA